MQITSVPTTLLDVEGAKPMQALARLGEAMGDDASARAEWRKRARIAAVTGSCPRSLASLDSGVHMCSGAVPAPTLLGICVRRCPLD